MRTLTTITRHREDESKFQDSDVIQLSFDEKDQPRINVMMSAKAFEEMRAHMNSFKT